MGDASFDKKVRYRALIGSIFVIIIVIFAVGIVQSQRQETLVFSYTEYNVKSYPYYFRASFEVKEHPSLDAYLRVQMICQGLSSTEDVLLNYILYTGGNVSILDFYHDPRNATVNWLMSEEGLSIRHGAGTIQTFFDEIQNYSLTPGGYVWVHYISAPVSLTALVFSVTLSIVYK
ncbi:MAG: hypothetical protein JW779_11150 [Candidatus Thorarchaeota archaeon]|nr:hypothetical protein [Candidatus Thorarchaeota archaeon]